MEVAEATEVTMTSGSIWRGRNNQYRQHNTGIGKTLEDICNIPENNLSSPEALNLFVLRSSTDCNESTGIGVYGFERYRKTLTSI